MALIHRMTRLFQADMHAVLDRIEEPEQSLRQAIREMEADLDSGQQQLRQRAVEQRKLQATQAELETRLADIEHDLDLCFKAQKDDLARGLVRKKLEAQGLLKRLRSLETANADWLSEQQARLEENRSTLESLRQKAEILALKPSPDSTSEWSESSWATRDITVSDSDVEVAFVREQNARRAP